MNEGFNPFNQEEEEKEIESVEETLENIEESLGSDEEVDHNFVNIMMHYQKLFKREFDAQEHAKIKEVFLACSDVVFDQFVYKVANFGLDSALSELDSLIEADNESKDNEEAVEDESSDDEEIAEKKDLPKPIEAYRAMAKGGNQTGKLIG